MGHSYVVTTSTGFATADISKCKVIIIASDQPTSFYDTMAQSTQKIKLKNFVKNGGILIAHMCDQGWQSGWWSTSFLPRAPSLGHVNLYSDDVTIVDASHPIINGPYGTLTDADLDGWYYSTHGYFTNLPANAKIIIVEASTGEPILVEWKYGNGRVIATMQTMEWAYSMKNIKAPLKNEIAYAQKIARKMPVGGEVIPTSKMEIISIILIIIVLACSIVYGSYRIIRKNK